MLEVSALRWDWERIGVRIGLWVSSSLIFWKHWGTGVSLCSLARLFSSQSSLWFACLRLKAKPSPKCPCFFSRTRAASWVRHSSVEGALLLSLFLPLVMSIFCVVRCMCAYVLSIFLGAKANPNCEAFGCHRCCLPLVVGCIIFFLCNRSRSGT